MVTWDRGWSRCDGRGFHLGEHGVEVLDECQPWEMRAKNSRAKEQDRWFVDGGKGWVVGSGRMVGG